MKFFKFFSKASIIQPILSLILIGVLVVLVVQFFIGKRSDANDTSLRQLTRKVTLDEAVNKYMGNSYESYTQGSLIVKNSKNFSSEADKSIDPQKASEPSPTSVNATENKYDDMFFTLDKGQIKKLDLRSYGQNETLFFNEKGEIVFQSNSDKTYSIYPIPAEGEKDAQLLFDSTKQLMQDLYPLGALIRDYKAGKFNPVERAVNVYSGKWQHPLFTSGEIVDVFVELNPVNGLFTSFSVVHSFTSTPSRIFFDFKPLTQDLNSILKVPGDYKQVELKTKYKAKE